MERGHGDGAGIGGRGGRWGQRRGPGTERGGGNIETEGGCGAERGYGDREGCGDGVERWEYGAGRGNGDTVGTEREYGDRKGTEWGWWGEMGMWGREEIGDREWEQGNMGGGGVGKWDRGGESGDDVGTPWGCGAAVGRLWGRTLQPFGGEVDVEGVAPMRHVVRLGVVHLRLPLAQPPQQLPGTS